MISTINMSNWKAGEVELGEYSFNLDIPLEFQLSSMIAYEVECPNCDLSNDCRECQFFEFSLLHSILKSSGEL